MQLILLTNEFPPGPGGIGTHAYQLAHRLHNMGWHITVFARQNYESQARIQEFNQKLPFEVVSLKSSGLASSVRYWQTLVKMTRKTQPNILVATGSRMVWLATVWAKQFRSPWVAIGHGSEFGFRRVWEKHITKWAFRNASAVICVSQYTHQYMLNLGINPKSSYVIPNGADENTFRSGLLNKNVNLPFDDKNSTALITVGNVTERKGQDIVIQAMPTILQSCPNTHYLVIGLPTKQEEYAQLAKNLGVDRHVHFLGRLGKNELVNYLNTSDIFIMTSRHTATGDFEGYGIAVIEAALCGKPAVVSANSGLMEAVSDGVTGLVVPENDPLATAQAIIKLIKNPQLRSEMGFRARQRALKEQVWEKRIQEYHKVLSSIASKA